MNLSASLLHSKVVFSRRVSFTIRSAFAYALITAMLLPTLAATPFATARFGQSAARRSAANESVPTSSPDETLLVTVRHAPNVSGLIDGSIQLVSAEHVDLDSGADITEDLLVPGTPAVKIFGYPHYRGTIDADGSMHPSGYSISLSTGAALRYVVRRTDPVIINAVAPPPTPNGKRNVTIYRHGQSAGDFSTLRDLTTEYGTGQIAVPPGTYGEFTANDYSGFTFGVAGSNQASVYNLQELDLGYDSKLKVVGPVILNVAGRVSVGDCVDAGSSTNSSWLSIMIANHGLQIGDNSEVFANVQAPNGQVKVEGKLFGTVVSNNLFVDGGKIKKPVGSSTPPPPQNQAPVVNAGPAQTIELPASAVLNGTVTDDGLPLGGTLTEAWSEISGPGSVIFSAPTSTSTNAAFSIAGTYVLRLSANDGQLTGSSNVTVTVLPVNQAPIVNAGAAQTIELPSSALLNGTITDDGFPLGSTLTVAWSKVSGPGTVSFSSPNTTSTTASFSTAGTYVLRLTGSDGQLSGSSNVTITVLPVNQAPIVNAGAPQTIELPAHALLNGSVTDDGFPTGSTVTVLWSKVSGPGTVTFTPPNATSTSAAFSVAGTYVLRLTGSDGQLSASSDVTITVLPVNQAPVVNAGLAQTTELPATATLSGTVTDDGLPLASTLSISWSQVSGPGTTTFTSPNSASTIASFSTDGTYVLRLSASDGQLTGTSDVTVTVFPINQPPVVNAGPNQEIAFPGTIANLNGTITDDGFPVGSTLRSTWSEISGPGTVTFGDDTNAVTTASFSAPGVYVLRLTASDGPLSSSSDVKIKIDSACVAIPSGLVGWWTGEGNASDSSLNANDGTLINGVSFSPAIDGRGFTFNGTNSVQIPDNPTLKPANVTVDTWVKFDSLDSPGAGAPGLQYLIFKKNTRTTSFEGYALIKLRVSGVDRFIFFISSATGTEVRTTSVTAIQTGQFYHVVGTYDGVNTKLYVNGVLESQLTAGFPLDYDTRPLSLGSSGESFDGKLVGTLDEVHIFNRALSASEVQGIFSAMNFGICNPLTVSAGPDQTVSQPTTTINLNGTAIEPSDPTATITSTWSTLSSPGTVTFDDPSSPTTTASFTTPGVYVLQLTATDGQVRDSSTVNVIVLPSCTSLPLNGLVGWWRGEGDANDFFNNNNGTLVNNPGFVPAVIGQGFQFNGTNSVQIPDNSTLKPANVTVDTWVRFDSLDSPGAGAPGLQYLIFKKNTRTTSFEGYALIKLRVSGVDKFIFFISSASGTEVRTTSVTAIQTGQFYHVVGTYDGVNTKLYVNGVLESQLTAGFPLDYSTRPLSFGSSGEGFDGKLVGVLDEIHIFNRALTDAEVLTLHNSGTCH